MNDVAALQREVARLQELLAEGHRHCPNCEWPVQPEKLQEDPEAWAIEVTIQDEAPEPYAALDLVSLDEWEAQQNLGIYTPGADPRIVPLYRKWEGEE